MARQCAVPQEADPRERNKLGRWAGTQPRPGFTMEPQGALLKNTDARAPRPENLISLHGARAPVFCFSKAPQAILISAPWTAVSRPGGHTVQGPEPQPLCSASFPILEKSSNTKAAPFLEAVLPREASLPQCGFFQTSFCSILPKSTPPASREIVPTSIQDFPP